MANYDPFVANADEAQTTWSIDESNVSGLASDENSGIDDAHPLLNPALDGRAI